MAAESALRKDYYVKLNIRVGFLKMKQGQISFDNLATAAEIDKLSKSSCNTQFKINKWNMTNLPNLQSDYGDNVTYQSESLKDAISRLSTQPKSTKTASVASLKSTKFGEFIFSKANPNTIDLKQNERQPRPLNSLTEGRYTKRMSIQGKDKYNDSEAIQNYKQELYEQAINQQQQIEAKKNENRVEEIGLIN